MTLLKILEQLKTLSNEEQLLVGSLLLAGINREKADENASWDVAQDEIEKHVSNDPEKLLEMADIFDTIASRIRERAEDIDYEA